VTQITFLRSFEMANPFTELVDVVEHLVRTHPTWNEALTQTEALEKVAAARVSAVAADVPVTVEDFNSLRDDVKKLLADVEGAQK
jgi:hypothetical protein